MRRIISFVVGMMVLALAMPPVVSAEITVPEFEPGDKWTYEVVMGQLEMDFDGDWTFEVKGEKTVSGHEVYDISLDGDGTVGMDIPGIGTATMDFTVEGYTYMRISDLATLEENMTIHMSTTVASIEMSIDMYSMMSYSPPMKEFEFPLEVGNQWEATSTVTASSTFATTIGTETTSETMSDTYSETKSFHCEAEESVNVPAGSFQSMRINQSEAGGDHTLFYVASEVGFQTKSDVYDEEDGLETTMRLKSYSYSPGRSALSIEDFWWLIVIIVIVVVTLAGVVAVRSRRKKEEYPPSPPEYEM